MSNISPSVDKFVRDSINILRRNNANLTKLSPTVEHAKSDYRFTERRQKPRTSSGRRQMDMLNYYYY